MGKVQFPAGAALVFGGSGEDFIFGGLKDAFHAAQQSERKNDAAILRLLEIAAEEVGNGPEKSGGLGVVFVGHEEAGRFISSF